MKSFLRFVAVVCFLAFATVSFAKDTHVNGYTRKDGTYVAPHYRSAPDGNFNNNYSTKGNTNPYTGEAGTKVRPSEYGNSGLQYNGGYGRNSYQQEDSDKK